MYKSSNQTKSRIVSAAWQLFYRFGYDNTTVEDIVEKAGTSKGSFYHYFSSKDDLLGSLSFMFDEKYEEFMVTMDEDMDPVEKLTTATHELFLMIENTVSVSILSKLFSTQLVTKSEKHLLDPDRTYYKFLRQVAMDGKSRGIFKDELSVNDITRAYALYERAIMYDWCISNGNYSLCQYSEKMLPVFMEGMLKK